MEVHITAVKRTPRVSKSSGKAFVSLGIKTQEHGDKWLSGFGNKGNEGWEQGSVVNIEVEQKGEYLNFSEAKAQPSVTEGRASNMLEYQVMPLLKKMAEQMEFVGSDLKAIHKKLYASDYPEHNETNDASGFDEPRVGSDGLPF